MSPLSAIFYGIVQGITEFLPVSSSGHLSIIQNVFGGANLEGDYFSFDILLHLATLVAVFIVYYRDIFPLVPAFFTMLGKVFKGKFKLGEYTANERFVIFVIIATLPLVAAVPLNDRIEVLYSHTKLIGLILIINGVVLFVSDLLSHGDKDVTDTKPHNALIVGMCQMCALLPGLSRSGSTITGGLLQGYKREYAVRFSFILSIPAILGANILKLPDLIEQGIPQEAMLSYGLGMLAAMLSGIAAMKLLIYISKHSNFRIFSIYCMAVGITAIILG